MNKLLKIKVLALSALFCSNLQAQEQEKIPVASRFNLKATVGIPTVVSNKALRNSFRGIYDAGLNFQIKLFSGLYTGIHGNYTGLKISNDKIALLNTECRISSGGINIGYEKFASPRVMWYANLAYGYNWLNYYKVECTDTGFVPKKDFIASSIRPMVGFSYYSDDNFSLGMFVSYTYLTNEFDPTAICLQKYSTYRKGDSTGNTSYISIGVVLNLNLRKDLFRSDSSGGDEPEEN